VRIKNKFRLSYDDKNLRELRKFTKTVLQTVEIKSGDTVLECGPNRKKGAKNSPVFEKHPDTFFDIRHRMRDLDFDYYDLDIDPSVSPRISGDLSDPKLEIHQDFFDKVLVFSVLEHVFDLKTSIANLQSCMKKGGELHIITPWDLRFHGPRPDCWRISDDAYEWLLRPMFTKIEIVQIKNRKRPLSPVGLYVVATK
jgi:hypothetical protein